MAERVPMTVKVDREVKEEFTKFVKEQKGQKYGEMGRMAERALEEYMDNDRLARIDSRLDEMASLLEEQKEESKKAHPGSSVREREDAVIRSVVDEDTKQVHRRDLEAAIKSLDLTTDSTIKKYIKNITNRPVFKPAKAPSVWNVVHEHAEEYY